MRIDEPQGASAPSVSVAANTAEWRDFVNERLDARGRGTRADLARFIKAKHPKFSTGQLSDILGPDEYPGQMRWTQYKADIDAFVATITPVSRDTHELQYLLEGLAGADIELLRQIRDMSGAEQKALAAMISAMRKPK